MEITTVMDHILKYLKKFTLKSSIPVRSLERFSPIKFLGLLIMAAQHDMPRIIVSSILMEKSIRLMNHGCSPRTRQVDLCIGSLEHGFDQATISELNHNAVHHTHEDCIHCAYMPYCGIDIVDDLSRYARFDVPKHSTWFCQRHMFLFDFIFEKVAEWDTDWLKLFNSWIFRSRENSEHLRFLDD